MKGNRTLIGMSLAVVWAGLALFVVDVPLEDQEGIAVGVLAIFGIIMRLVTTTPVGKAD